jgi:hypothetical protein
VRKYGNMRQVLQQRQDNPAWLAQIGNLTSGLDPRSAGDLLFQLGHQYIASGQSELAAEVFTRLTHDNPDYPLTDVARGWLLRYYASGEAAWQATRRGVVWNAPTTPLDPSTAKLGSGVRRADLRRLPGNVIPATASVIDRTRLEPRWTRAVEIGQYVERRQPALFADPAIRFPLVVAERKLGSAEPAERLFTTLSRSRSHDAWWACAAAERWLVERRGTPPKPVWKCRRTATRPHLDGHLDEPSWQDAEPVKLTSHGQDDALWPASAELAYDSQFLYLAVQCRKAPGAAYPTSDAPRPRDPDLSAHDRIDLLLDIDRDYASYYRLTVDHRGWTGEACLDDVSWNPTWYVAAHVEGQDWTIEAAIPWRELRRQTPQGDTAWAAGVQRVVPGVGFQAWTKPANLNVVAEGFGLLMFQ